LSLEPTEKEEISTLDALRTPIKSTKKKQRKTPLYFKTRRAIGLSIGNHKPP